MRASLVFAVVLTVSAAFAEEKIDEAPPDRRPTYSRVREDLSEQFKDRAEILEAVNKNLGALEVTRGFEDLHGYQILKTDDGRVLLNLELPDGRAVFYDPEKGELVEMDPKQPDKLTRLDVKNGQVSRSEGDKRDTDAFMKPFGDKTKQIRLGGATGRYFFDGQQQLYGETAARLGPGRTAAPGEYLAAPKRMVIANAPGAEAAPEKLSDGQTHYWIGKELYYRAKEDDPSADLKVGYMTKNTEGKVIFYHGGAFPPDTGTGNHSGQKEYWALYSVGDGQTTVKLGRYHEVIRTWPKEKIAGEGKTARLDISEHHRTVSNVPLSRESGEENRAILRQIGGKYYRDTQVAKVELYDYGPPARVGNTELKRFVDRGTGDLYAEHLVHGTKRLVRTGRQAVSYPIQPDPESSPSPSDRVVKPELLLPPAPEIEPEEKEKLSRAPTGLQVAAPADVGTVLGRLFPGAPATGAPRKGYSWFQDARKALGAKDAIPVSREEFDLLVKTYGETDNDVLKAKVAVALGSIGESTPFREEARQTLVKSLIAGRGKPLVRNTVSGIPSYQEAAAHSLLRMGDFKTLIDWAQGSAGSDTQALLRDPAALWSAYVLAQYTRDLAYSSEHSRQFLAYPIKDGKEDPGILLRPRMGDFAQILNSASAGFKNQDDLKWRIEERLSGLRGAQRRFEMPAR